MLTCEEVAMATKPMWGWQRIVSLVLLLLLTSAGVLMGVVGTGPAWSSPAAHAADAPTVEPDRISFYNVPADHKLESHLDYADGRAEKIKYPAALCAPGMVITHSLNLYEATFVAEGCEETVFQQLNLRWLGGCWFEFEHDPQAHIVARGPYGETVLGDGLYPAGEVEFSTLPASTTSIDATMRYTDTQGRSLTGNVAFSFYEPHPGCGLAPTLTPTNTATPTSTATPTLTATPTTTLTPVVPQQPSSLPSPPHPCNRPQLKRPPRSIP
jgi:hypothetical protein